MARFEDKVRARPMSPSWARVALSEKERDALANVLETARAFLPDSLVPEDEGALVEAFSRLDALTDD